MRSGKIILLVFGIAAVVAACSRGITPSESGPAGLKITVEAATIRYDTLTDVVNANFPVKIKNESSDVVYFGGVCGTFVMRETARQWIHIQKMNCVLITQPPIAIPPESTYVFTHQITGVPGERDLMMWMPPLNGTYRVMLALGTRGRDLPDDAKTSDEFVPVVDLGPN